MRYIAQFMEKYPMPAASDRSKISKLVSKILDQKKQKPDADVSALEAAINAEVYK